MEKKQAMENPITLKLFVDNESGRIVFGEAEKDFIDFLFSLFTLPLGSVTRILTSQNMMGCLGTLYQSVQNLSDTYIQQDQDKNYLLRPKILSTLTGPNPSLLLQSPTQFYSCSSKHDTNTIYVTDNDDRLCPVHNFYYMRAAVAYVGRKTDSVSSSAEGGYVKSSVTYMVTDDLMVTPLSTMSTVAVLNKFNVRDVSALQEMEVKVGMKEGLALLRASLQSTTALNDVFRIKQEP